MRLFDSHCHLFDEQFAGDLDGVIARAAADGVQAVVIPAVDAATAAQAIELADRYPGLYVAAGIHPESLEHWRPDDLAPIRDLAAHPKVVAIGEIGLDYHWDVAPHDVQQDVLRRQLQLAKDLDLPVILHNRESTEDLISLLESEADGRLRGIMHCFTGTLEDAKRCMDIGFYISFGGPVTFKNAKDVQAVATQIPTERLLVETDSPYLSPHPLRGQRNEPARVALVAQKLAELRGETMESIAEATFVNALHLFRIPAGEPVLSA